MSNTERFPINFFKSIWTPKQIYLGRKNLNWFQLIFILLFLNSLLVIPVSIHYAKMDSYPMENTFPNTYGLIDESVVNTVKGFDYVDGTVVIGKRFLLEKETGIVGAGLSDTEVEEVLKKENALIFTGEELLIKEGDHLSRVKYTKDFDLSKVETVKDLQDEISRQWFLQNKSFVVGSFSLLLFSVLLVSFLFIVFGSALFIYFARRSRMIDVESFKESVNLIINCASLGSIAGMIIGLIHFDIVVMIMIQSLGLIIMLLAVFVKRPSFEEETVH